MDDTHFEDLFATKDVDMLQGFSQESLIHAAANIAFNEHHSTTSNSAPATRNHSQNDLSTTETSDELPDASDTADVAPESPSKVIQQIEKIFESIANDLSRERDLTIRLKTRSSHMAIVADPNSIKYREMSFPGKSAKDAWRFTITIRILELIHEALRTDVVLSKRDIYYRDPALFGSQAAVDRYVDDIAFTLNLRRSQLNVTAAAKGLVAGAFRFCRRDGSILDAFADRDGILIPSMRDILSIDMTAIKWILVIEKEATFRSIAASTFWDTIQSCGVILTGKGYPDIATRALVHFLSMSSPQNGFASPPVFGLADCDPDGLAILSIYCNGSAALAHENEGLCVPQLQWLGLRVDHMMHEDLAHGSQGLLTLTARDRRRAIKMLERSAARGEHELHMNGALQSMLMLNTKAELQLLDAVPNGMTNLLGSSLGNS